MELTGTTEVQYGNRNMGSYYNGGRDNFNAACNRCKD